MSDNTSRPAITEANIVLGVAIGANTPRALAAMFGLDWDTDLRVALLEQKIDDLRASGGLLMEPNNSHTLHLVRKR